VTDEVLRVSISSGSETTIVLEGELDFSSSKMLLRALERVPMTAVTIFDLSGLEFIDSSGLTIIANYARRALPDGRVTVVAPRTSMRRLFTLTALDTILTIVERAPE
jgi:anti-anti-sigma factor